MIKVGTMNEAGARVISIALDQKSKSLPMATMDELIEDYGLSFTPKSDSFPMPWDADIEIKGTNLVLNGLVAPGGSSQLGKATVTVPLVQANKVFKITMHRAPSEDLAAKLLANGWIVS